ncbi:hypothetical protein ADEAN_000364300 [Angomonas deanei]|uniref:Uncharacterized protein n=1 Tax=Angomonas deanei TaxID=59799 RepID=A0A7G2CDH5_9TRYP|nr:hypothetical protein ADEAN_000364300 [Angomonas deanei]
MHSSRGEMTSTTLYEMVNKVQVESAGLEKDIKRINAEMDQLTQNYEARKNEIVDERQRDELFKKRIEEELTLQKELNVKYMIAKERLLNAKNEEKTFKSELLSDFLRISLFDQPACEEQEDTPTAKGEAAAGENAALTEKAVADASHTATVLRSLQQVVPLPSVPPEVLMEYFHLLKEKLSEEDVMKFLDETEGEATWTAEREADAPNNHGASKRGRSELHLDIEDSVSEEEEEEEADEDTAAFDHTHHDKPVAKKETHGRRQRPQRLSFEEDLEVVIPISGVNTSRLNGPLLKKTIPVTQPVDHRPNAQIRRPPTTAPTHAGRPAHTNGNPASDGMPPPPSAGEQEGARPPATEEGKTVFTSIGNNITRFVMPFTFSRKSLTQGDSTSNSNNEHRGETESNLNRRARRTVWKM